jgi:hypothetical protein
VEIMGLSCAGGCDRGHRKRDFYENIEIYLKKSHTRGSVA